MSESYPLLPYMMTVLHLLSQSSKCSRSYEATKLATINEKNFRILQSTAIQCYSNICHSTTDELYKNAAFQRYLLASADFLFFPITCKICASEALSAQDSKEVYIGMN